LIAIFTAVNPKPFFKSGLAPAETKLEAIERLFKETAKIRGVSPKSL